MATIKVKQASINELRSAIMFAAEQADEAAEMVSKSVNDISDMSFLAKPSLESELTSLKNRLTRQARLSRECCRAVQETVDLIVQVDNLSGTSSEATWGKFQSGKGHIIVGVTSLDLAAREYLRRRSEINNGFIDGASGAGVTTTPTIGGDGQGSMLRSSEFDWTRQLQKYNNSDGLPMIYAKTSDQRKVGIARYNIYDGEGSSQNQVSCTYYTLRKLNERGLGFPFKTEVSPDGKNWYANCVDTIPKAEGAGSIQSLVNRHGAPLENIVVSFEPNHVLLIDKAYYDASGQLKVSYSDMYDWEHVGQGAGHLTDENASFNAVEQSIDEFINRFSSGEGSSGIVGSVLVGS